MSDPSANYPTSTRSSALGSQRVNAALVGLTIDLSALMFTTRSQCLAKKNKDVVCTGYI